MPWYLGEAFDALRTGTWESAGEVLSMMNVYQQKQSATPLLTGKQVSWELFYNKGTVCSFWSAMGYMAVGAVIVDIRGRAVAETQTLGLKTAIIPLVALVVLIFLLHTSGIGIRWYISERAPWGQCL